MLHGPMTTAANPTVFSYDLSNSCVEVVSRIIEDIYRAYYLRVATLLTGEQTR
jgi:hypothetical protein